jgi:hypothetical protein
MASAAMIKLARPTSLEIRECESLIFAVRFLSLAGSWVKTGAQVGFAASSKAGETTSVWAR